MLSKECSRMLRRKTPLTAPPAAADAEEAEADAEIEGKLGRAEAGRLVAVAEDEDAPPPPPAAADDASALGNERAERVAGPDMTTATCGIERRGW